MDLKIIDYDYNIIITSNRHMAYNAVECNKGGLILCIEELFDKYPYITYSNSVNVCRLIVQEPYRNQGIATALMTELVKYLDSHDLYADLCINSYGDLSHEQLVQFYMKFGFTKVYDGLYLRIPNTV